MYGRWAKSTAATLVSQRGNFECGSLGKLRYVVLKELEIGVPYSNLYQTTNLFLSFVTNFPFAITFQINIRILYFY